MNHRAFVGVLVVGVSAVLAAGSTAQTELTPFARNPILVGGPPGSWDDQNVLLPEVVVDNGTWYLFYTGMEDTSLTSAIGLATSSDGVDFGKDPGNPIFTADGTGFDAGAVHGARVVVDNGTWYLYYTAVDTVSFTAGDNVGLATATQPAGPYTRLNSPVLTPGSPSDWDSAWINGGPVLRNVAGYSWVMFYTASAQAWPTQETSIGMATSSDGVTWNKYDDPTTTSAPFAVSDPVFRGAGAGAWDATRVAFPALHTDGNRFDLYYQGSDLGGSSWDIGTAGTLDPTHWTRFPGNPLMTMGQEWFTTSGVIVHGIVKSGSTYSLYYYGVDNGERRIGVAHGTETDDQYLDAHPQQVVAGDTLTLSAWQGAPTGLAALFVTSVDGVPFWFRLGTGGYDAVGTWAPSFTVPNDPALQGRQVTFQTLGISRLGGKIVMTNPDTVTFQ